MVSTDFFMVAQIEPGIKAAGKNREKRAEKNRAGSLGPDTGKLFYYRGRSVGSISTMESECIQGPWK